MSRFGRMLRGSKDVPPGTFVARVERNGQPFGTFEPVQATTDPEAHANHPFEAPEGRPWGLCVRCSFSEAAHTMYTVPYEPDAPRAVPANPKEKQ